MEDGTRLVFRWWDDDDGEDGASRVVLTVMPSDGPTRLLVRETAVHSLAPRATAIAWEARLGCLAVLLALVFA